MFCFYLTILTNVCRYEAAVKSNKNQSYRKYIANAQEQQTKNAFKITDTEQYQIATELHRQIGDVSTLDEKHFYQPVLKVTAVGFY